MVIEKHCPHVKGFTHIRSFDNDKSNIYKCPDCNEELIVPKKEEYQLSKELGRNLTRKEAQQIIRLMSWAVEESNNELIKNDFKRLSDRLMEITRYT